MLITSLVTSKFLDNEKYINFTIAFYQVSNGLRTGNFSLAEALHGFWSKYTIEQNCAYTIIYIFPVAMQARQASLYSASALLIATGTGMLLE